MMMMNDNTLVKILTMTITKINHKTDTKHITVYTILEIKTNRYFKMVVDYQ